MDQGVKDVGDGRDPPAERDVLAAEPTGVAAAIPRLVVRARDLLRQLRTGDSGSARILTPMLTCSRMRSTT